MPYMNISLMSISRWGLIINICNWLGTVVQSRRFKPLYVLNNSMATDQSEGASLHVPPLENTAFFSIEDDDGYVRIEQSLGNQVLYTPNEARDIAEAILDAVDEAVEEE